MIRRRSLVVAASVALALAALWAFAMWGPESFRSAYQSFLDGSVSTPYAFGTTLRQMVPILLTGVAASLTFRGGLFDVGQPGYLVAGALAAAVTGSALPGPPVLVAVVSLLVGALAGTVWAAGVAWTTSLTGVAIVVVSLIAANLADGLAKLITTRVVQDPAVKSVVETRAVPEDAMLPILQSESQLRAGIVVALVVTAAVTWWSFRTTAGHRLHMFGANPEFAALAGTPPDAYRRRLTMTGGALSGLAGGLAVFDVYGRYVDGTLGGASSPAWLGVTVAIMTPRAILLLPVAFLLAMMQTGFEGTQRDLGIGGSLGMLIQALLLVLAALARRTPAAVGA